VTAVAPPSMSPSPPGQVSVCPETTGAGPAVVSTYVNPGASVTLTPSTSTAAVPPGLTMLALSRPVPFWGNDDGELTRSSFETALPLKKSEL
jgi:hypothetical protein